MRYAILPILLAGGFVSSVAHAADGDVEAGMTPYAKHCSQCHGDDGAADGAAANFMLPRPRVFKDNSTYKFRTTQLGVLPHDDDLFRVITKGIPGTSMPAFDFLSEQDRWNLVAVIKSFSEDFVDEDYTSEIEVIPELATPTPVPTSEDSIARGSEVYVEMKCAQCHGDGGRGNGPSYPDLKDAWGNPILPTDLTNPESLRGGREAADIFRTVTAGLDTMPSFADSTEPEDRWHLANYIISLQPPRKDKPDERVVADHVEDLPTTGDDERWQTAPVSRFKMMPNIVEPPRLFWSAVEFINVQALYSDNEVALRIQWDDRSNSTDKNSAHEYEDRDTTIYKDTDHPDQFAVQLPAQMDDKARPYFLFGDKKRPVNLWWWRADTGETKAMLGKGYGAIAESDGAGVEGEVTFDDGRYTMVVRRSLQTEDDKNDIQLAPDTFVPIAFHAWDGERGEVGARHSLATWYWLYLKPAVPAKAYWAPPVAFVVTLGFLLLLVRRERNAKRRAERI